LLDLLVFIEQTMDLSALWMPRSDVREPSWLAMVLRMSEVHEEDTQDISAVIEDTQDRQTRLSQRVDVLIEDREFHQETLLLME
ncbi:hypothetical protein Tco_0512688, partial [Tanacetum coccineum]